jgi:citrate synthase
MPDTLTITDNRTGKQYELPIRYGTCQECGSAIDAMDLRQIKTSDDDFGLLTYDPGYTNTASCKSKITYIDGDKGILRYRGYAIEQLARQSNFLEVAYLIIFGELPTRAELDDWVWNITHHTMLHENNKKFMDGFQYDAHPMGILISTVAALSTFYTDAKDIHDEEKRMLQIYRLVAKIATIAAYAYRHSIGMPYVYPNNDLSYAGNFLSMMFRITEKEYRPDPVLERTLDTLFVLHIDHEQNCSTSVMRGVGSSLPDPYVAAASAAAALYGPLHGGANERVLRMLKEIGDKKQVPAYIKRVKEGDFRLMGFGHRIYKSFDPRAEILKELAPAVLDVTGSSPLLDIAMELERVATHDDYFIERKLYPNVDFYSGIIYEAIGFPTASFPVMFAIPRVVGWLSQWVEMLEDADQKIARPRQLYMGEPPRVFMPIEKRG